MNNPLKYADPSGYQWMKKMAFQLYSNGEDSYSGMSSWGGGGAPSNTPHIDRMLQESMNQDASGGWRMDSETGEPYNLFTYEYGWDALGEHVYLPKNIDQSSLFFGSKKGVRGVWYQSGDLVGNYKGWRDGINSPDLQFDVKNTFSAFDVSKWDKFSNYISLTGMSMEAMSYAATSSANYTPTYAYRGMAQAEAAAAKFLGKMAKVTKFAGTTASVITTGYSAYKVGVQFKSGGIKKIDGLDFTDAIVGSLGIYASYAVSVGIVASGPIGWGTVAVGTSIYGIVRVGYELYNEP